MQPSFENIFVKTKCPTQQQLLDYVEGRLSGDALHEVEEHLTDCELCNEALEGLAIIQQKEQIPGWLRQMKWEMMRKLRKKNHRRRRPHFYVQLALTILAILFLLLAAFWAYHFFSTR